MSGKITFQHIIHLLKLSVFVQLIMLTIMFLFRMLFFYSFAPDNLDKVPTSEILKAFWLGTRLDLSILGYTFVPIILMAIVFTLWQGRISYRFTKQLFMGYLIFIDVVVSLILAVDYGYYAYFNEHITLFIFGFFDDDTMALLKIFWKNYPAIKILFAAALYIIAFTFVVKKIFSIPLPSKKRMYGFLAQASILFAFLLASFLAIRGSLGMFPVYHWLKDVSGNHFVNQVRENSVYSLIHAVENYLNSLKAQRNLVKEMGFKHQIDRAFRIVSGKKTVDLEKPEKNLLKTTPYNEKLEHFHPNIVVIQVESFGMPILKYQSEHFDIMRHLKKHFDEDILFTNFISAANGTISSMEPMLLNLVKRPNTIPYGQSIFQNIEFPTAAARLYEKNGYETRFLYGGDLSWRNVGKFFPHQGFEHVEGKSSIAHVLHLDKPKYFHDWGIYDQFLYQYILKRLKEANKPQFIYAMTTNNHPPYELYTDYQSKKLTIDDNLSKHLKGDREDIVKRLYDYQYTLDMVGRFLDAIKSSPQAQNTVVVVTADNNTIEGRMKYDNFYEESKKIPFYIYLPPAIRPEEPIDTTIPGSHKDLFPTLYHLTLSRISYMAVGSDLLDKNVLHCGINEAGIVITSEGAFQSGAPKNKTQQKCDDYRKAAIAVTDYLVKHWYKKRKKATNAK